MRAHYVSEGPDLEQVGADASVFEETEIARALVRVLGRAMDREGM